MSWLVPLFFYSVQSWALCLPSSEVSVENFRSNTAQDIVSIEESALEFSDKLSPKIKKDHKLDLNLNLEVLSPKINAEVVKNNSNLTITVWGGMMRHHKMTPQAMTLLLCHELGHMSGGAPFKSMNGWSSTEGQADYESAKNCAKEFHFSEDEFTNAALSLTTIYAEVTNQAAPLADQCDPRVVERINFGYPSPQCRFDTLLTGWNSQPRPRCWFKE